MTRGTSTTTEWISAWSDLMDADTNDCALATVVVQTIPPMNQSGSSARFMRADYSRREVGAVRLVWLESVGDVQLHLLGTAEPGASEAEARADSQNLGIGPVRRHGYQRGCAFHASISLAAWSRNALRRPMQGASH
jgi:Ran GTPase-activating protein (RanGAP) involved in mRNA processing and transport